jgi:hypothetical protein
MERNNMSQTHKVEAYSLVEFVNAIQASFDLGYRVDQSVNSQVATGGMGYYRIVMQKGDKQIPALFKPKAEPEPEAVLDSIVVVDQADEPVPVVEPFKPSVMFVAEQVVKKKAGRPKSAPQSI